MSIELILLILLIIILLGVIPTWPYSREWGYRPSGIIVVLIVIIVVLMLLGRV